MGMSKTPRTSTKSKTWATWIAIVGGSLGWHRFYLHGFRDIPGWLHPAPTLIGLYGVMRMRSLGQDDQLAWILIPLLGCTISAAMLAAIVYGLTSDEKWNARFNPDSPPSEGGLGAVLGVMLALLVGSGVLMATIAFAAQRYFEYQVDSEISTPAQSPVPLAPAAANG
jgi:hypothetical protein